MRITTKGQVTIPIHVRERLALTPSTEIDFVEENGRFYLVRKASTNSQKRFKHLRGVIKPTLSTDEIMRLTRSYE